VGLTSAERQRLWRERNPEKIAARNAARREARIKGTIRPRLSEDEKRTVDALWEQGLTFKEIADQTKGRTAATIAAHLRSTRDIPPRPAKSGPAHHSWKGGRYVHHGYVYIRVSSDDPMAVMRSTEGNVAEHRLVMARSIGRPLTATETVHHINGDKLDNRIENLQLRQGRHGKGSVMRCLDCGSHNLGHAPLAITED